MIQRITIFAVLSCLLLSSCSFYSDKEAIPEGYSKLTVIVEDSSTFYLDRILAKNSNAEFKLINDYDTVRKQVVYVYDSLKNNEYEVILSSLFDRTFQIAITLRKDTTIFISKEQLPNYDTISDINNFLSTLEPNDTICIAYSSSGCFHHYRNKTLIYRNDDRYMVEFTTDTSHNYNKQQIVLIKRQLDTSFSDALRKLELGCMEGLTKQRYSQTQCISTTSSTICINRNDKVFELTNSRICEIPYFNSFIDALKLE